MRKLASVQIIDKLEPIEGADRIEKATVLGWHVVVQKGLYKEGDKVVYLEIDSVLPKDLAARIGFTDSHLKTRRFKGVYSQGMCLPITELPAWFKEQYPDLAVKAGQDVTAELGITKWEPDQRNDDQWWKHHENIAKPPKKWYTRFRLGRWFWKKFLYKPASGPFPTDLVPKTDETRVQVLGDILSSYKGVICQYTEKLDGSSITFWKDNKLHVCSRNREIYNEKDFMFAAVKKMDESIEPGLVYQGEILGPNIQGNKYGLKDYEINVYQAYDPVTKTYLTPDQLQIHCEVRGLKQVPILGTIKLTDDIDSLVELSIGMSQLWERGKETQRECIVIRPLENIDGLHDKRFVGGRLSFKVINPKFLIKYDK